MDLKYYEEREKVLKKRVEFNDKLKVVHLLKAVVVDEGHKRDILSKINFNKDPAEVFEDAKTAIRDICTEEAAFKKDDQVLMVKPWQENDRYQDRTRSRRDRFSRSRSFDISRDWSSDRRGRNFSRERGRDRSWSRGRERTKQQVSFHDRARGGRRRDSTLRTRYRCSPVQCFV